MDRPAELREVLLAFLRAEADSPTEAERARAALDDAGKDEGWLGRDDVPSDAVFELFMLYRGGESLFDGLNLQALNWREISLSLKDLQQRVVTPHAVEAFMATAMTILRGISGQDLAPLAVHFRHNREAHRGTYEEFFGCPLVFDAPDYKVVIPRAALDYKCNQANPQLADSIDSWMSDYLAGFETDSLSTRVRRLLTEKLPDGEFMQDAVASELAMSPRSLQRGLQKEGTNFKELLDMTRRDLAKNYIRENQLSLIEVCCLLGFSDQSNFTKAFKRWTGKTPLNYRQDLPA